MQTEHNSSSYFSDVISEMKNRVINQPHEICVERARLITISYKKTKGENSIIRYAKAINHVLKNMKIIIWKNEFIVGNRCTKFVGTPLYPEVRIDTIEQDLELYNKRETQKFFITEADKEDLKEIIIPYWKLEEETVQSRFYSSLSDDLKELMMKLLYIVDTNLTNGVGHFFPGHKNILENGIDGLIQQAKRKKTDFSRNTEKVLFLDSVLIVLYGVKSYITRFSIVSKKMAENEHEPKRRKELFEISNICANISSNPPNTFKEALQLIYFTHVIAGLEDGGFAISIGRLDQILYPYYTKDRKEGKITDNEVKFLIQCFYLKLTTLWNYVLHKGIVAAEGPPISQNLTIGGVDKRGKNATNELSYLLLESYTSLKTVQPAFSVRVHEETPSDLILKTGEAIKSGASLALFNDSVMIPGLLKLGYSLEDAREYAPIGCVEPVHPYKSFGCTNATQLNIVKCLELTLNNGKDMFTKKEYGIKNSKHIQSFEDLWSEFAAQLKFFVVNLVKTMVSLEKAIAELSPKPFLSATTDNCIDSGVDVASGGAVYDFTTTQLIGLATVADSLTSIKQIIFEEKLLSYEELVLMLSKNYRGSYKGKKGEEWRQIFINRAPKFGNDNEEADTITNNVVKLFCEEIINHKNYRGGSYNPGIYSTSFHLALGFFTAASADGRKSRDPLSNGIGPSTGMDKNGPTAILNSIMRLENEIMTNGNSVTLDFHPSAFKLDLFLPLIRSFFKQYGGYHLQFNIAGKESLLDAQKFPEKYTNLVVRIAGYPVLFNELSKSAQDSIIARTQF
ncbi:MAG: 4-hydroxyphenylacetate decarboxylase large subunit [Candidatus Lokiarchaeum sp. GC14_75]|nr:MAG: 4-hydroxyphenylacetate decarboxylase large subunit [Candidatus Lokiarchaeum sp. GC14_75]